MDTKPSLVLKA